MPKGSPKTTQDASKTVPGGLRRRKMSPNASKKAPPTPKTLPKTAPQTPLGILNSDLRGAAVLPALRAPSARPVVFSDRQEGVWDLLQNLGSESIPPTPPHQAPRVLPGSAGSTFFCSKPPPREGPRRDFSQFLQKNLKIDDFCLNFHLKVTPKIKLKLTALSVNSRRRDLAKI